MFPGEVDNLSIQGLDQQDLGSLSGGDNTWTLFSKSIDTFSLSFGTTFPGNSPIPGFVLIG